MLIALGESACGLHESARVIAYLAEQSAGQCGPCVYGLRAIADAVGALADGVAHASERDRVLRWTLGGPRARRVPSPRRRGAVRRERARACSTTRSSGTGAGAATRDARRVLAAAGAAGGPPGAPASMSARLRVNPITCEAHGLCAELLPELIRLDDWGYPILDESEVPPDLLGLARRAVDACPTLALLLDDDR